MTRMMAFVVLIYGVMGFTEMIQASDREKLLSDAGVYGTFAVFQIDDDWWKLDKATRASAVTVVKEVFQKHGEKIAIDSCLSLGLSDRSDFFVRLHAAELVDNQNFLVDLMSTVAGNHLKNVSTFNGITKKANYVPSFPDELKRS